MVVEVRQHDQYGVKVDGTGRITLRNRKNLRKFGHASAPDKVVTQLPGPRPPVRAPPMPRPPTPKVASPPKPQPITSPPAIPALSPLGSPETSTPRRPMNPPRRRVPFEEPASVRIENEEVPPRQPTTSPLSPVPAPVPRIPFALSRLLPHNTDPDPEVPSPQQKQPDPPRQNYEMIRGASGNWIKMYKN